MKGIWREEKMGLSRYTANIFSTKGLRNLFPGLTYVEGSTSLHHMHPLVKLVILLCFSIAVFALPSFRSEFVLFVLLLIAYRYGDLGLGFFTRKLRFILVFGLLIFLVQVLWVKEGYLIWQFSLGRVHFTVWSEGFWGGLGIMLRFINVIGSSYLFVATTDPNRLAYSLMQAGLPYRIGFMLITALRFIPLFHLELAQVKNAQMAKGIELEGVSPRKLLRAVRYLMVPLVISALSKVDILTISMESRAFGLYPSRSYLVTQFLTRNDKLAIIMAPLFTLLFYFISVRLAF
jgi:energy-coupling factor transport system permease protein